MQILNAFKLKRKGKGKVKQLKKKRVDIEPGQRVSIDQYQSTIPGRRLGLREKKKKNFVVVSYFMTMELNTSILIIKCL